MNILNNKISNVKVLLRCLFFFKSRQRCHSRLLLNRNFLAYLVTKLVLAHLDHIRFVSRMAFITQFYLPIFFVQVLLSVFVVLYESFDQTVLLELRVITQRVNARRLGLFTFRRMSRSWRSMVLDNLLTLAHLMFETQTWPNVRYADSSPGNRWWDPIISVTTQCPSVGILWFANQQTTIKGGLIQGVRSFLPLRI